MRDGRVVFRVAFVVLMVAAVVAGLYFTQTGEGETVQRYRIAVIVERSADARWLSFKAGMEQAAEEQNLGISIVPTGDLSSVEEEQKLAADEIAGGADGLIMEFCTSKGAGAVVNELGRQTVLVLIRTKADTAAGDMVSCVCPDNTAIGRALGEQLQEAFGTSLKEKRIGVLKGRQTQTAMEERLAGFSEAVTAAGGSIVWSIAYVPSMKQRLEEHQRDTPADVLVALDNRDLEIAVDYLREKREEEAEADTRLFGAGNSEKNVYFLDSGLISGMVVPDEYDMGYRAALAAAERLRVRSVPAADIQTGFSAVTRETMFLPKNERLLFPVAQ